MIMLHQSISGTFLVIERAQQNTKVENSNGPCRVFAIYNSYSSARLQLLDASVTPMYLYLRMTSNDEYISEVVGESTIPVVF